VCDAHHILRPLDDGDGMRQSMQNALDDAGIDLSKGGDRNCVDMFNCHATSTQKGDPSEAQAIKDLLI